MSVLRQLQIPVIGAPMAGGVSSPLLVSAVSDAGGLGMLGAGYQKPDRMAADLVHVADLTDRPFGVNLFVPHALDREALEADVEAFAARLGPEAAALDVQLGQICWGDTDHFAEKALLVQTFAPAVVSCTFGIPGPEVIAGWKEAGSEVHITVTSLAEARAAQAAGADVLVLQGQEAGGHRGTHDPAAEPEAIDHLGLLEMVAPTTELPLVAAGGITTAGDVRRALATGATAVQVGTALLLATESGASGTYRRALRDPRLTRRVTTRAFSGRVAGALVNGWVDRHGRLAPPAFPVVDQLTKPLRRAAAEQGDVERTHLWAGVGWRAAQDRSAAQIVRELAG